MVRVVFDIGHGSDTYPAKEPDKGVRLPDGSLFAEHSFNSAVAVRAKMLAESQGIEVLFPQQPNSPEVSLSKRSKWINSEHDKNPIKCLVSFHADNGNGSSSGWSVFHWHTSTKGKKLAGIWAKYARQILLIPAKGIRMCVPGTWSNFHIVRVPKMPCILVEHFYFDNLKELAQCNTPEYINVAAEVTVRAVCEFAGITYDPVKAYKANMQSYIGFDDPDAVWALLDKHNWPEALYRKFSIAFDKANRKDG